jgi:hypothetical protein
MPRRKQKRRKRPYWRHVVCDGCFRHCRYRDFKVFDQHGFVETQQEMRVDSDDPADWKYKRRGTVLGRMHAHKRELWEHFIEHCPERKEDK